MHLWCIYESPTLQIFFLTHGYTDASNSSWMEKLQDRLLLRQGARVLRCGWSKGAGILHMPYSQAPANIYSNGFNIAGAPGANRRSLNRVHQHAFPLCAVTMQREYEAAPFATLTCIGHSLGAHSCGMAGKMFALGATEQAAGSPLRKKLLDRIIALDPAGPTFDDALSSPVDNPTRRWRITPSDAAFVFGLHTDAINTGIMAFGTAHPVGHLDVYVTPGALQPLCRRDPWFNVVRRLSCSHSAAIWYLIDSLVSGPGGYASKHWCAGTPVPFAPTRVTPVPKFPPCNGAADNTAALQWGIDAEAPPAQGASRIVVIPAADVPSSAHAVIDTQR